METRSSSNNSSLVHKIVILLLLWSNFSSCQNNSAKKIEVIDQLLSKLNSEQQFNGGFMIGNKDSILFTKVYGYANIETKQPLDITNSFGIASVNKSLTATLIMRMVELEYFTTESKLVEFFPELPYKEITIDHLLTHTSGIPFYYDNLVKKYWNMSNNMTNEDLFKLYEQYTPKQEFPAGEKFSYSNAGYMFLAGIAERASKKTYDTLLKELIFEPSKMKETKRLVLIKDESNLAKAHALSVEKSSYVPLDSHEDYQKYLDFYFRNRKGAGGLNSTLEDLWKFSRALQTGKIIKDETFKKMLTPAQLKNGKRHMYARGWQLEPVNGKRYVGHRGGSEGENCFFRIALDDDYTYFLISNAKTPYLSNINKQIKSILQEKSIEKIKISGVERLSLLYAKNDFQYVSAKAREMGLQNNDYYFTLSEFNAVSWNYWLKEDFENALNFLKLATIAMPDNAGTWEVLAEAYMELGRNELAIKHYKITIDKLNSDPTKKGKKWVNEWIVEMNDKIKSMRKN
ncbi:serine hydrolase [uncultured Winogradskyella sp.]|uniref:serine hydrolase n=1 Tax=uncultured Winogradskyella sp. TaxID=395353 RepID=UPI0026188C51|nr:serine hydrolase [uncultured Winogradskyella sp.]